MERGIDVDVKVGLDKAELARIIGDYDGLAVRSATKVTEKIDRKGRSPESGRPGGNRRRQYRRRRGDGARHNRHEHAVRQFHHHG